MDNEMDIGSANTPGAPEARVCPDCGRSERQVRAGLHGAAQRYRCMGCGRRYMDERQIRGYPASLRRQALALLREGLSHRAIGRELGVSHRTVSLWLQAGPPSEPEAADRAPQDGGAEGPPAVAAKRRATIVDVARRARVSVSTVSNFLNNKGRMAAPTRERVRRAMEELSFTPSSLTRALRERRTGIIGVVTFGLDEMDMGRNPVPSLLVGINRGANLRGYNVLSYTQWPVHHPGAARPPEFLNGHIDGLIWVGPLMPEPELETVARAGLPAVALLARRVPAGVGYVAVDNIQGIVQIVRHLAGLGHRRIAWAGPLVGSDFVERLEGYRKGLEEVGLAWDSDLVAAGPAIAADWFPERTAGTDAALDRWLALPDPPTAIVLTSDGWAEWVAEALRRRGRRVPDDIAVTGFDDIPLAGTMAGGLTTVRQDFREIGRLGVDLLAELIDGAPVDECRITLPATIVVRASTAGAAAQS